MALESSKKMKQAFLFTSYVNLFSEIDKSKIFFWAFEEVVPSAFSVSTQAAL